MELWIGKLISPRAAMRGGSSRGRMEGPRGFSLVELVIVIMIIGIGSAIALPRYGQSLARYRADAAAGRIVTDLDIAQSRAYSRSAAQSVTFTASSNSYQIVGMSNPDQPTQPYTVKLGVDPYFASIMSVDFNGDVTAGFDEFGQPRTAGTIVLSVGVEQRTIKLDVSSGRAKVQ